METKTLKKIISDQKKIKKNRFIFRDKFSDIKKNLENNLIIIISGIRRCGKSTLMNYIREINREKNYYLNFDDFRLVAFELSDFQNLIEAFYELYNEENFLYFDEIQNIESWERAVRTFFEEEKKIIITGSNSKLLSKELGTHLTGRNIKIELYPFSFKEFLRFKKFEFKENDFYLTQKRAKAKKFFNEFLDNGGFPYFLKTKNIDYLKSIYEDILYRDIIVRYKLKNEKNIKLLAHYLASNISKEFSFNKIKNLLNISNPTTVKEYISYLENAYLFFTINKFDYSLKKQIYNNKKVYFCDTGLLNQIAFNFSENYGRRLENVVFLELKRQRFEIYYHKQKKECDFVIKEKDKITKAIQVSKSLENEDTRKREIDGLIEAMKIYNLKIGYILTDDEDEEIKIEDLNIIVKPVWKWLIIP